MKSCSRSSFGPTPSTPVPSSGRGHAPPRRLHDIRTYGRTEFTLRIGPCCEIHLKSHHKTSEHLLSIQSDRYKSQVHCSSSCHCVESTGFYLCLVRVYPCFWNCVTMRWREGAQFRYFKTFNVSRKYQWES